MLLLGVVAVVLGGNGKTSGVAVASVFLASFQEIAGWQLGTRWEETAAFLVLLAFLLCRPQGILGRPLRKAEA
jgi:branched-chain amino acid transport system permease protein